VVQIQGEVAREAGDTEGSNVLSSFSARKIHQAPPAPASQQPGGSFERKTFSIDLLQRRFAKVVKLLLQIQ
jgi:hypothetical protein